MKPFAFARAADVAAAISSVSDDENAVFLGGGTNLVDLMRLGVARPDRLVDVSGLSRSITEIESGALRIGGGVRNSDLAADLRVRRWYPALSQALLGGWELGGIFNARSGIPINVLVGRPDILYRDSATGLFYTGPAATCQRRPRRW